MDLGPAPIEVVPGRSKVWFWAPYLGGLFAIGATFSALGYAETSSFGASWTPQDYVLSSDLQMWGFLVFFSFVILYFLVVPFPLGTVEISPIGIRIDYGLRVEQLPWSRVHRVGNRLYTFGRLFGFANRYVMTDYQASRIALFLPG